MVVTPPPVALVVLSLALPGALPSQEPPASPVPGAPAGKESIPAEAMKVVPGPILEAGTEGLPPENPPPAAEMATMVYTLKTLQPKAAVAALREVLGVREGDRFVFGPDLRATELPGSRIIVTGKYGLLDHVSKLLRIADGPQPAPERERTLKVFEIQEASAPAVVEILIRLMSEGGMDTTILADGRSNKIIARAASPRVLEEIALLIKELDVLKAAPKPVVRVVALRHARAEEIASVLQPAFAGPARTGGPRPPMPVEAPRLVIAVDGRTNSLVIEAPEERFEGILHVIEKLDVPVPPEPGRALPPEGEKGVEPAHRHAEMRK